MPAAPAEKPAEKPDRPDPFTREWMLKLGYVHESEIEEATNTTSRSRARWKTPRGVMFGNMKWFPLREIKRTLDARAEAIADEEIRTFL
ncbi:MAG: hypothetical protein U9Q81_15025 [Pseudomonadota bacterium]|nr:hypothetical protein [Pseudomonadota bacterium]